MKIFHPIYEVVYSFFVGLTVLVVHFGKFNRFFNALPPNHTPDLGLYMLSLWISVVLAAVVGCFAAMESKIGSSIWLTVSSHKIRLQGLLMVILGFVFLIFVYSTVSAILFIVRSIR